VRMRNLITPKTDNFDCFYIVMDIMETDLKQVLRSGQKLTDAHIQFFVYQALRGLRVIHSAGVIHRDITPANILVNTNCDLKLCDFGLAKEESEEGEDMTDYVTMRWYRAPELVMEHKAYSTQIDVWGIGLIMAEMFGTKPLCQGKDRVNQLDKIIDVTGSPSEADIASIGSAAAQKYIRKKSARPPMNLKEKLPGASADALDLLSKMLQFHPDKRITVAQAMKHPYLAQLYDEADEKIGGTPFSFDENKHRTVAEVKKAIMQESIDFHKKYPKTAPMARPILGVGAEVEGRAAAGSLEKPEKDQGRFQDN